MDYNPPVGGSPGDPYVDANPGGGVEGSPVPAASIEYPQREIVAAIEAAGLIPDNGDLTQLAQAIQALAGSWTPVGSIILVPGTVAPAGTVKLNGALLPRSGAAALWAYAQASGNLAVDDASWTDGQFSPGDGATTFRVPDARGNHFRAWDDGRGIDAGRAIGSLQLPDVGAHSHSISSWKLTAFDTTGGANSVGADVNGVLGGDNETGSTGGPETRVRNIPPLACIKY